MKLCHARDRTELIHAVKTIEDSPIVMTHCGWQVKYILHHVKAEWWGNSDMQWCSGCTPAVEAERIRNSIVQPPRKRAKRERRIEWKKRVEIAEYRESHSLSETAEKFRIHRITVVVICNQVKAGETNAIQV